MGGKWGGCNDNMRDPCGNENIMYLDCININILVVILFCSFADVTMGENQVNGTY